MADRVLIANCPICSSCKAPIAKAGILIHGNVCVVNTASPDGDGGGFVGDNFPRRSQATDKPLFAMSDIKKSAFHWECFATLAEESMRENDARAEAYFQAEVHQRRKT